MTRSRKIKYDKRYAVIILSDSQDNCVSFDDPYSAEEFACFTVNNGRAIHSSVIDESNGHTLVSFNK